MPVKFTIFTENGKNRNKFGDGRSIPKPKHIKKLKINYCIEM